MRHMVNLISLITLWESPGIFQLPDVACPNLFEYIEEGNGYFGRITLSDLPLEITTVNVRLMSEVSLKKDSMGLLSTENDTDTVNRQLHRGEPIKYRVDFPLPNKPPKILSITVNDKEVCVPPPQHALNLQHTIFPVRESPGVAVKPKDMVKNTERPRTPPNTHDSRRTNSDKPLLLPPTTRHPTAAHILPEQTRQPAQSADSDDFSSTQLARANFPWLTAIYGKFSPNIRLICSGSLISRRTVISASHCFATLSSENILVYLGHYNLTENSERGHVARGIEKLMLHRDFNNTVFNADADIAILQLDSAVDYSQYIAPISLWYGPDEVDRIAGNLGTVVGWGKGGSYNTISSVHRMIDINIASKEECLRHSWLYRTVGGKRTFCAENGNNPGPCSGDAGAGLIIRNNGVWMLRGIVSAGRFAQGHCDINDYVIYCDVAKHLPWVKDNMV